MYGLVKWGRGGNADARPTGKLETTFVIAPDGGLAAGGWGMGLFSSSIEGGILSSSWDSTVENPFGKLGTCKFLIAIPDEFSAGGGRGGFCCNLESWTSSPSRKMA